MKKLLFLLTLILFISCENNVLKQKPKYKNLYSELCSDGKFKYNDSERDSIKEIRKKGIYITAQSATPAQYIAFIDFDGHNVVCPYWNGGKPINCTRATLTSLEIKTIMDSSMVDFKNFNINLTTDSVIYFSYPANKRIRVIVTDNTWRTGVSGVAYNGSIKWGDETPAFVFSKALNYNTKYISEIVSHEVGHTVSLSHQIECNGSTRVSSYRMGTIMGNSLYTPGAYWGVGPSLATGCLGIAVDTTRIINFLK
jgi:hypothetical protein